MEVWYGILNGLFLYGWVGKREMVYCDRSRNKGASYQQVDKMRAVLLSC